MPVRKSYKILINYIIGPVLFVVLAFSIYRKIKNQPNLAQNWEIVKHSFVHHWGLLLLMILLMLLNWTLEAKKWQILIRPVQKVSLLTGLKAVLSGLSFSLFIPNGMGEYLGRMIYLNQGNRLRSIAVSFMGSLSQLLITLILGVIGLYYLIYVEDVKIVGATGLSPIWFKSLMYAVFIAIGVFLLLYFKIARVAKVFQDISFVRKHRFFVEALTEFDKRVLWAVMSVSLVRYCVFLLQYLLMFYLFGVHISLTAAISGICVMFLLMAIVPTIPIAELGVRAEISLRVFGLLSSNIVGILSTSILVWMINLVVPAIIGSLFVVSVKLYKKTNN